MKKLSAQLLEAIEDVASDLSEAVDSAREYHDGRSEAWQDSDKGAEYLAWVEELEAAVEALQQLRASPGTP